MLWSQDQDYTQFHIGYDQGLSTELCEQVEVDDIGNLWIGSNQDLNKFDGYNIKTFNSHNSPLLASKVDQLFLDVHNHLWVFQSKAIKSLDREKYYLFRFNYELNILSCFTDEFKSFQDYTDFDLEENITRLYPRDSILYILTDENKIYSFTGDLKLEAEVPKDIDVLGVGIGLFYFAIEDHILKVFDFANNPIHYGKPIKIEFQPSLGNSGNLFIYKKGILRSQTVISKKYGINYLYEFDGFEKIKKKIEESPYNSGVYKPSFFENGILYGGKYIENGKNNSQIPEIIDILKTELGKYVIANTQGVHILRPKNIKFNKIQLSPKELNSTRTMLATPDLLMYRYGKELIMESPSSKYDLSFLQPYKAMLNDLVEIYQDPLDEEHIWMGGWIPNGMAKIDLRRKKVSMVRELKDSKFTKQIHRSPIDGLLYGISDQGIYTIDDTYPDLRWEEVHYPSIPANTTYHGMHFLQDKTWLLTEHGLYVYDAETKSTDKIEGPTNCSFAEPTFIHVDKNEQGLYWIGTRNNGLLRWDLKNNVCQTYNEESGMSNNRVHNIHEDNSNRLWISTNKNLSCLDKSSNHFTIFGENDGISHTEFNQDGHYYDSISGKLYLGSMNGYTFFQPDSVQLQNKILPKTRILSGMFINKKGKIEDITHALQRSNKLEFLDRHISGEISFSTTEIKDHHDVSYSYRIMPLFEDWKTQRSHVISLNRIPYGSYTLEVSSEFYSDDSRSEIATIEIEVVRPIYKHPLFLILLAIFTMYLTWKIFQFRSQRIIQRNQFLETTINERTQELRYSNEKINKLFTLLAHDLRNPITSLSNISRKVEFLRKRNRLEEIVEITQDVEVKVKALNQNLDDILHWAIAERSNDTLEKSPVLIRESIEEVLLLYKDEIKFKDLGIDMKVDSEATILTHRKSLLSLLRNFVSNAIKFNRQGGKIIFETQANKLYIIDSGIGMANSDNSIINKQNGYGLGLAMAKEIGDIVNIDFQLKENKFGGTTIEVTFH